MVTVALAVLASAVVAGLPASALAQTDEPEDGTTAANATADDGTWPTDRADAGRTGATTADGPEPYGTVRWDDSFSGKPPAAPTVVGDTAYFGAVTASDIDRRAGAVAAYDVANGDIRWQRTGLGGLESAPSVVDGTAYVATAAVRDNVPYESEADGAGGLYALDAESGETQWVRNDSQIWTSGPVHADGTLYATRVSEPNDTSSLVALDPDSGATLGSVEGDRILGAADGIVYGVDDGELFAARPASGEKTWSTDAPVLGPAAVTDDAIYAVGEGVNGSVDVAAYATADGSTLWNVSIRADTAEVYPPAVADGGVYVTAGHEGELVRLDAATGTEAWRFEPTEGRLTGGPTVANDTVYVGGSGISELDEPGERYRPPSVAVYAVDADTGAQQWGYVTDAWGNSPYHRTLAPSVTDDALYLPSHSGDPMPGAASADLQVLAASADPPDEAKAPSDGHYEEDTSPDAVISTTESNPAEEFGENKTVVLNASESSVNRGTLTAYEWDVDDDGTFEASGEAVTVTVEPCQTRTVTFQVTTDGGETATESVTLTNG